MSHKGFRAYLAAIETQDSFLVDTIGVVPQE